MGTKSSNIQNLLCSAEFTSRYIETDEKVVSELMANEMRDEWLLEPSVRSSIGIIRVGKRFYMRKSLVDFIKVNNILPPFKKLVGPILYYKP